MRPIRTPRAHTWSERFLSSRAQLGRGSIARQATDTPLDDTTVLRRRPGSICEVRVHQDGLRVLLGDRRLEMPAWLAPAMRRVAAADMRCWATSLPTSRILRRRVVLARRLIREGLLRTSREGAPRP